jgi:hypothetical protein
MFRPPCQRDHLHNGDDPGCRGVRPKGTIVKSTAYQALSASAVLLAAMLARKLVSSVWRGDAEPPLNPADRRVSWREGLTWAVATGVGAAVARLVALRGAAAGWELTTGEAPPGIDTA